MWLSDNGKVKVEVWRWRLAIQMRKCESGRYDDADAGEIGRVTVQVVALLEQM